eukprot:scaffold307810_cov44-Prasinocladus_malaysianus.AAC.1
MSARGPAISELFESAVELPTEEKISQWKKSLHDACLGPPAGQGRPPSDLAVLGLPNSGTNALYFFLNASLTVPVSNGPKGVWKHLLPFHPELFRRVLADCQRRRQGKQWTGYVLTVRHPVAWFQAQLSNKFNFGSKCLPRSGTVACHFDTCHRGNHRCPLEPSGYTFPTLLDLWAAYANHTEVSAGTYVVRYEDFLEDRERVLTEAAQHFGLEPVRLSRHDDPAYKNSRPWVGETRAQSINDALRRWKVFQSFWKRASSAKDSDRPVVKDPIACPIAQRGHSQLHASSEALRQYKLAHERDIPNQVSTRKGYEVPDLDSVSIAKEMC